MKTQQFIQIRNYILGVIILLTIIGCNKSNSGEQDNAAEFFASENAEARERFRSEIIEFWDTVNVDFPYPTEFYDSKVVDSMNIKIGFTPRIILKAHATRFKYAHVDWGMMYGILPSAIMDFFRDKSDRQVLMNYLVHNRTAQENLYRWAKETYITIYASKSDTAQAYDMFGFWKLHTYLVQYDYQQEVLRSKEVFHSGPNAGIEKFVFTDWMGREDSHARLYAFVHRRIAEYLKTGEGISQVDALYWSHIICKHMWDNSSDNAKKVFNDLRTKWEMRNGKLDDSWIRNYYGWIDSSALYKKSDNRKN